MKLLIVEPHGDDAFISCSSALMNDDLLKVVLTMSDRDSHRLTEHYESVHQTIFLGAPDVHYDLRIKYSTHDVHRKYLAGENLYEMYIKDMNHHIVGDNIDHYNAFLKEIESNLHKIPLDYDLAVVPLGLFHPNHYATWRAAQFFIHRTTPMIYYVDKPYIEKRYVQEILKCSDYDLYTASVQDKSTRQSIFKDLYPTEQGLLRYSSESILEWKDIYAVSKNLIENPIVKEFITKVSDMEKGDKYENLVYHVPQN